MSGPEGADQNRLWRIGQGVAAVMGAFATASEIILGFNYALDEHLTTGGVLERGGLCTAAGVVGGAAIAGVMRVVDGWRES